MTINEFCVDVGVANKFIDCGCLTFALSFDYYLI